MSTPYRTTQSGACAGCGQYRQGLPCTTCVARPGPRLQLQHSRRARRDAVKSAMVRVKIAIDRALMKAQ